MTKKKYKKVIGCIFGMEITLSCKLYSQEEFDNRVELAKKALGGIQYIYFDGYKDGHHPEFFEKYPELKEMEND